MFAGYHLCYLYKSNTMLKHTAVVRPSGWRRKASKERLIFFMLKDENEKNPEE